MRILLSNDDGIHAPGIQALARAYVSLPRCRSLLQTEIAAARRIH
ncbi:5'/3'-nucleotidase SurE [Apirhabdus apintestini]|nr:5'/3'-nucleotidase SurE [Enterobacteriaceae bacterium CA-0114]